jgi:DNA replication protein
MDIHFNGFEESRKRFTGVPEQFFSEILPNIQNLDELKVVLYLLWSANTEGDYGLRFTADDLLQDKKFMQGIGSGGNTDDALTNALEMASQEKILIKIEKDQKYYFLNTPRGRTAATEFSTQQMDNLAVPVKTTLDSIKPNIFRLYEENIGPLTPLIADMLKDTRDAYPEEWIQEAIQIAVKNNVRRWKYVESILERWQEEGRDGTDRRNTQEDYERYLKGEYGDIGKHW